MRVLEEYFGNAGPVTPENAWEHVYRCMLWVNESAGLAHIDDSNHMQPGGGFHKRAVRFTEALCARWNIDPRELGDRIDYLFKGCVEELRRQQAKAKSKRAVEGELDPSELVEEIKAILDERGIVNG